MLYCRTWAILDISTHYLSLTLIYSVDWSPQKSHYTLLLHSNLHLVIKHHQLQKLQKRILPKKRENLWDKLEQVTLRPTWEVKNSKEMHNFRMLHLFLLFLLFPFYRLTSLVDFIDDVYFFFKLINFGLWWPREFLGNNLHEIILIQLLHNSSFYAY